jgi:hypothetical protein
MSDDVIGSAVLMLFVSKEGAPRALSAVAILSTPGSMNREVGCNMPVNSLLSSLFSLEIGGFAGIPICPLVLFDTVHLKHSIETALCTTSEAGNTE